MVRLNLPRDKSVGKIFVSLVPVMLESIMLTESGEKSCDLWEDETLYLVLTVIARLVTVRLVTCHLCEAVRWFALSDSTIVTCRYFYQTTWSWKTPKQKSIRPIDKKWWLLESNIKILKTLWSMFRASNPTKTITSDDSICWKCASLWVDDVHQCHKQWWLDVLHRHRKWILEINFQTLHLGASLILSNYIIYLLIIMTLQSSSYFLCKGWRSYPFRMIIAKCVKIKNKNEYLESKCKV